MSTQKTTTHYWVSVSAILLFLCLIPACVPGQRLLQIQVEVDGVTRFEGYRGVSDSLPISNMWQKIEDIPLANLESTDATPTSTKTLKLEGDIVVRILHTGSELSSAKCDSLQLDCPDGSDWYFAPREVARIQPAF